LTSVQTMTDPRWEHLLVDNQLLLMVAGQASALQYLQLMLYKLVQL